MSFGPAEADVTCPVPLETLAEMRQAEPADILHWARGFSEEKSVRLALYCYNRAHLRKLGLTVASGIDPVRLAALAGVMGEVLAAQCRATGLTFGVEKVVVADASAKAKPRISLAGQSRAA